ncbi:hypothetical protein D3C72_1562800 [compost metagenome]
MALTFQKKLRPRASKSPSSPTTARAVSPDDRAVAPSATRSSLARLRKKRVTPALLRTERAWSLRKGLVTLIGMAALDPVCSVVLKMPWLTGSTASTLE